MQLRRKDARGGRYPDDSEDRSTGIEDSQSHTRGCSVGCMKLTSLWLKCDSWNWAARKIGRGGEVMRPANAQCIQHSGFRTSAAARLSFQRHTSRSLSTTDVSPGVFCPDKHEERAAIAILAQGRRPRPDKLAWELWPGMRETCCLRK